MKKPLLYLLVLTSLFTLTPLARATTPASSDGATALSNQATLSTRDYNIGLIKNYLGRTVNNSTEIKRGACIIRELFFMIDIKRELISKTAIIRSDKPLPPAGAVEGVNINKSCQYGYYLEHGEILKIFPISSGRAGMDTPSGIYKIYYRYKGWWESTIYPGSMMYNSQYFNGNRAIHALTSDSYVYPTPSSHGCVRVEKKIAIYLWQKINKGSKVRIYGRYW